MKKIFTLNIAYLLLISCVNDIDRIKTEGYVYDYDTKKPLQNVRILQIVNGSNILVTKTSEDGYFGLKKKTKMSLGTERHILGNIYVLEKEGYQTDTLEIYGGVNDIYKKDSLFIKSLTPEIK